MTLRKGFKSEANKHANELRKELGREPHEALCPWELAAALGIQIFTLGNFFEQEPSAVSMLHNGAKDEFSAISVFQGRKRLIVHNDSHHPYRQAANIAHELSHAILLHPPTPPFNGSGERNYCSETKEIEEEANWLGPALLISEEAALHIVTSKIIMSQASQIYKASEKLIMMRLNVTGARKRTTHIKE
ncbi:MAG: ImmA/IrrE family metallo-endopeptidase [Pseudomonadota bacterium]